MAKQIVDVSKHLIEVAIEANNFAVVSSNVQKIQGAMGSQDDDKFLQPFLCVAQGLCHLNATDYYAAAREFLKAEAGMGSSCNTIISPNDVAIYGGLCALATMDRNELQSSVMENSNFRTYLELEPHIRRAVSFFINNRYTACLEILEAYRTDYLLDLHLQAHVDEIYYLIRSKSIVQYFIPFSCVTLDSLNAAFAAPGQTIEKELVAMISKKELDARIDTQNQVSPPELSPTEHQAYYAAPHFRPLCTSFFPPQLNAPDGQGVRAGSPPPHPTHEHPRRRIGSQGEPDRDPPWDG